jgi:hypothetical protein
MTQAPFVIAIIHTPYSIHSFEPGPCVGVMEIMLVRRLTPSRFGLLIACVDPAPSYVPVFRDAVVEQRR